MTSPSTASLSPTPNSDDRSIYFDAPLSHFHMNPSNPGGPSTDVTNDSNGWLPATDLPPETHPNGAAVTRGGSHLKSSSSTRSLKRSSSRRSLFTNSEGRTIEGSTFIAGAAMTGPGSTGEPNENLAFRAATADASLTSKQRSRIAKSEAQDAKHLSRVIKQEAKTEKRALGVAINELAALQKVQTLAIRNEARAQAARTKIFADFQKEEALFLAARSKFEAAQSRLNSEDETMEIVRNNAQEATERLQEKAQEVDSLRTMFGVDERERAAKMTELEGKHKSCVIC
ncbi:hypothetical protein Hypma_006637 [Hypsizygus marmoreus]|uniref:Uncharacterized protein n=1 Tax=Hypsizygus marmoreus TaxID=39966 RepID=A0A369JX18_HYPMA|nr:hypothetical protein Hypma_006637 [Hypsizygus marmoreus]